MRYAIWDKTSPIIVPTGAIFTAEQWKEKYPVAKLDTIKVVCAAGEINGAFFGTLGQMKEMYKQMGADFSMALTDRQVLDVIEAFEDAMNHPVDTGESTAEERIASALETQVMLQMETVNPDDPDEE